MRKNISAIDGVWNLHRVSMKNSRGMSDEQISKIMEMKEKGAQYLNFQVIQNLLFLSWDYFFTLSLILDPEVDQDSSTVKIGLFVLQSGDRAVSEKTESLD